MCWEFINQKADKIIIKKLLVYKNNLISEINWIYFEIDDGHASGLCAEMKTTNIYKTTFIHKGRNQQDIEGKLV